MIPCLYDSREMRFDHNGIGKLADAQSCTVTEKRNGSYELKLICPADGIHAEMLEEGNIILAKPSDTMQSQPFRIYKITTPIDGKLEVQARHISYQLNFITVSPFSVTGCGGAMQGLKSHAASDCPFNVWTDVVSSATFAFINEETYIGLTLDDERIRQAIIEFRPRLVVIDPIQAYLGSDSDLQIAGRARKLMQRLGMWASVYDCAIVLIGHLNKKEGTKGLYRSLGSIDVVAAARSVLQVERDAEKSDIRIVRQIKNSLAPSDGEIKFSITAEQGFKWLECEIKPDPSAEPETPVFESKSEKAAYLIKKLLSGGDMRSREIYMRMSDEGISRRTAENTKKELGIRSYRKMRQWYWSMKPEE